MKVFHGSYAEIIGIVNQTVGVIAKFTFLSLIPRAFNDSK